MLAFSPADSGPAPTLFTAFTRTLQHNNIQSGNADDKSLEINIDDYLISVALILRIKIFPLPTVLEKSVGVLLMFQLYVIF